VLLANSAGLCVAARGDLSANASGIVRALSLHAAAVASDPSDSPVVIIETEKSCVAAHRFVLCVRTLPHFSQNMCRSKLIIKTQKEVTTAIHRTRLHAQCV